jgi:beta-phosphoglucomutase-like phosphatase (HAD superfamily)
MTRKIALAAAGALLAVAPALSQSGSAPPTFRIPGQPDWKVEAASLLGRASRDVRLEDVEGNVTVYHGMPLIEVLEKNGLDLRSMSGERKAAASVILATARDGYAVVFSAGELHASRANPRVFLVSETSAGPLPENEGPVRLIVLGDPVRSAYALATVELRNLAPR